MKAILISIPMLAAAAVAAAQDTFPVTESMVADEKAVFATVESVNVVPARARIGGTVAELRVNEGDGVAGGQVLASVGDEKLALQVRALDAQIAAAEAQLAQAQTTLGRYEDLFSKGTIPKASLDEARTTANVAANALKARTAERSVVQRQMVEGQVLAPASGRVLKVPVTAGTVVMAGEPVAMIAEENFVLRLRIPERHARFLKAGDPVRIAAPELGGAEPRTGRIALVYPQIEDGRVVADAQVDGLGDYFVGERVRVWVNGGGRPAFIVPARFIATRAGVDYVRMMVDGAAMEVPVQRGRDLPDGVEILSGVRAGDTLVAP